MVFLNINLLDFFFSPYLSILYIIVVVIGIFLIDKRHEEEIQKQIIATEQPLIEQIEKMSLQWRSHAHDFHNHVEVLHMLLEEENYSEAKNYMNTIHSSVGKFQKSQFLFNQPIVNALFQAKFMYAKNIGAELLVESDQQCIFPQLQTYDMIRLLGNLLDNALEEIENINSDNKLIYVRYEKKLNIHILTIKNTGRILTEEQTKRMFCDGYTTKKDHKGTGLASMKTIVDQHLGQINISNENGFVIFQIAIPE